MGMTKRATKRVVFAMVMMAMLICTTSLMAEPEEGGGEDIEGYCQNLTMRCNSNCLNAWYGCRSMNQNPDTCQDQYDWCMDECMGMAGDFWCGYRQV